MMQNPRLLQEVGDLFIEDRIGLDDIYRRWQFLHRSILAAIYLLSYILRVPIPTKACA
jgi:hypothetical protein